MASTTLEILTGARNLIDKPSHWTKGRAARDIHGNEINFNDPSAFSFCPIGAIHLMGFIYSFTSAQSARLVLKSVICEKSIPSWSDAPERTHAEVISAFDKAIAIAAQ